MVILCVKHAAPNEYGNSQHEGAAKGAAEKRHNAECGPPSPEQYWVNLWRALVCLVQEYAATTNDQCDEADKHKETPINAPESRLVSWDNDHMRVASA
jgi:hypothetical protein